MEPALSTQVHQGETVQPIDWTGGALHALLRKKIPIATSFLYSYHFYHHVSHPVVQDLRRRFIEAMLSRSPDVVIFVEPANRPQPRGEGTSEHFPELERVLEENYQIVYSEPEFRILRHRLKQV
jgi:hypothetical protein